MTVGGLDPPQLTLPNCILDSSMVDRVSKTPTRLPVALPRCFKKWLNRGNADQYQTGREPTPVFFVSVTSRRSRRTMGSNLCPFVSCAKILRTSVRYQVLTSDLNHTVSKSE